MARAMGLRKFRVKPPETSEGITPVDDNQVSKVAYELFERRGRTHGHDQEDWFEAMRIVRQRQRQRSGNGR